MIIAPMLAGGRKELLGIPQAAAMCQFIGYLTLMKLLARTTTLLAKANTTTSEALVGGRKASAGTVLNRGGKGFASLVLV